jgi:hypothetical protein
MARRSGISPQAQRRIHQDISEVRKAQTGSERTKVHAGTYVHDNAYDLRQHDCGPWMETPASSRVSRFRYDYQNTALQVQWRNNKNPGYVYLAVPYEGYRRFARISSKGKFINSDLNGYDFRGITPEELDAPSNEKRNPVNRVRG